jgi:HlyD family secretion protein
MTVLGVATAAVTVVYARRGETAPIVTSAAITRGSIVSAVSATGTLEAVTTVQVGSQVSGSIESLSADFNSIVRKGQVLARLEPSLYQSAIEQANANLTRADADLDRTRVALADAEVKLARAKELSARQLIPANELDGAAVARDTAAAQVRSSQAAVTQARASVSQARVNLSKTVITSPIDGIVISRNVDVGQTVAASLSAPVIFVIAADLTRMRLNASIDEADLGRIQQAQAVTFTVDAYPQDTFEGVVEQVRLNPVISSNVVTYAAIISAPNDELKLKPGMTASLTVEIARRDYVLRVPAAALRFRPNAETVAALNANASAPARAAGENIGTVWTYAEGVATPARVKLGVSDGAWTELVDPALAEGTQLVTRVELGGESASRPTAPASTNGNPLLGTQPQRRR